MFEIHAYLFHLLVSLEKLLKEYLNNFIKIGNTGSQYKYIYSESAVEDL